MTHTQKAVRWFLKHDVWLIPTCAIVVTGLTAWLSKSETGAQFWVALESMLLIVTVVYLAISYYAHYDYFNEVLKTQRNASAGLFLVLSGIAFAVLTVWVFAGLVSACPYPPHYMHIGLPIVSVGLAILASCCVTRNGFDNAKIQLLHTNNQQETVLRAKRYLRGYELGVKYCDIPTLLGLVLLAFVVGVMHWRFGTRTGAEDLFNTFVGGTVTFHLMLSNFIFAATSGE